ncbi:pilin [Patescibacteria group bacterium]|nr:pilin [Patescibacteria group bacterium]MCL5091394.1 pilin [Patescibacteria group bacterium]
MQRFWRLIPILLVVIGLLVFVFPARVSAATGCKLKTLWGANVADLGRCPTDYYWECSLPGGNQCCATEDDARKLNLQCSNYSTATYKEGCVDKSAFLDLDVLANCPNGYGYVCHTISDIRGYVGSIKCCLNEEEAVKARLPCNEFQSQGLLKNACIDKGLYYRQGESYCNNGKVYTCAGNNTLQLKEECSSDTVCSETRDVNDNISAACQPRNEIGVTCGDPEGVGNSRNCCCVDSSSPASDLMDTASVAGDNTSTSLADKIAGVLKSISERVNPATAQKDNQIMNACLVGSMPDNPDNVCSSQQCKCVYDENDRQNAKCNKYTDPVEYANCVNDYRNAALCNDYLGQATEYNNCVKCAVEEKGYWSAIGCIHFRSWQALISEDIFPKAIGLAGIISLLCIIYSAISIQTSAGNAEKIKKAQQNLTACITGLILIIFSVFILRLIGVSILGIPGFG